MPCGPEDKTREPIVPLGFQNITIKQREMLRRRAEILGVKRTIDKNFVKKRKLRES